MSLKLVKAPGEIANLFPNGAEFSCYEDSFQKTASLEAMMARDSKERFLLLAAKENAGEFAFFEGETRSGNGIFAKRAPLTEKNAASLRKVFAWTAPVPVLNKKCSFGCGDRLGLATAAHAELFKKYDAFPVFAQQSIRELTLTKRTYRSVIDDATFLVFQAGYTGGYGADGDHLKSFEHIDMALEVGVTMLTLDLSDQLHPAFADCCGSKVEEAYDALPEELRKDMEKTYLASPVQLKSSRIVFSKEELMRCVLIYTDAMNFAAKVGERLVSHGAGKVDLEISIDETSAPTLPEHHFFVANELKRRNVVFASLAPRFIGEFQKGIDYIGDLKEFRRQFGQHVEIADYFGTYKVSVHSGSDKFSAFPIIGELTGGHFHLKTAGTSWLEAVEAISFADPKLFREIYTKAFAALPAALKLYHITADFSVLPKEETLSDDQLPELLKCVPGRQLLHITYGAMLGEDPAMHDKIYRALFVHEKEYEKQLEEHFEKHISLLGIPLKKA
ncbi:MAG: hypothetical protein J6A21_02280 [Lentisphaeria bacterium]|nr:hypothetical protein [Lentisphaeria bacterium]